jgi:hypothetical protein
LGQAAAQLHRDHLGRGRAHPLQLLVDRDERALGRRGEEVRGLAVARLDGQQQCQLQARRLRLHPPQLCMVANGLGFAAAPPPSSPAPRPSSSPAAWPFLAM